MENLFVNATPGKGLICKIYKELIYLFLFIKDYYPMGLEPYLYDLI
jgi:hypothetical protein